MLNDNEAESFHLTTLLRSKFEEYIEKKVALREFFEGFSFLRSRCVCIFYSFENFTKTQNADSLHFPYLKQIHSGNRSLVLFVHSHSLKTLQEVFVIKIIFFLLYHRSTFRFVGKSVFSFKQFIACTTLKRFRLCSIFSYV